MVEAKHWTHVMISPGVKVKMHPEGVLSIIAIGAMLAVRIRRGDGEQLLGRLGIVLAAVILISGATGLVAGLLPNQAPGGSASAVGFLQNSLWWYVGAMAVVSVIIAGIRMAWEQRANPGKELLQSLLTLIAVSGAGLTIIGLAVSATDAFSVWVLNGATQCDVSAAGESNCFGTNVAAMIGLSATSPLALLAILILALLAMLMSWVQVALMIVRGGLLVILAGVLPITASFTNNGGLNKVGSYFMETSESGSATVGNPSEGGLGGLQSHALEISNTDVAKEFIKMIAAQRAYQSSSRIITSADEMLQELMNIKR